MNTHHHEISDPDLAASVAGNQADQKEIYGALINGLDQDEQQEIESLMGSNLRRLVNEGDSYST